MYIYICVLRTPYEFCFHQLTCPSINIPSAVPRLAPTRWLGPQFLTFWGPYLGVQLGLSMGLIMVL